MKIAVVGSGVSGLGAAWLLDRAGHDVHVFEQNDYCGGHSNTVSGPDHADVDTGFIVLNDWTYPNLLALFQEIDVAVTPSDMSFAVRVDKDGIEYSSNALFAQPKNLLNPRFHKMWMDLLRFYKSAPQALRSGDQDLSMTLGAYLQQNNYARPFIDWHIVPMSAAIWSTPAGQVLDFPFRTFIEFCVNHGLLLLKDRPQWRTVTGGSKTYVRALSRNFAHKIRLNTPVIGVVRHDDHVMVNGEMFDHVIMAGHADQTLRVLTDSDALEREILGVFRYGPNTAYLHRDRSLMPVARKAWASWNYISGPDGRLTLTYWMNNLQSFLPPGDDLFVTLNPDRVPDKLLRRINYEHPIFNAVTQNAQPKIATLQGRRRTWFCGAWCGYGFHEDGLSSGLAVAEKLSGTRRPWQPPARAFAERNAV